MLIRDKIEEYLTYLAYKGRAQKTIGEHKRFLQRCIEPVLGNYAVNDIRIIDTAKIIHESRKMGASAPQRAVVTWRCYLRYLIESGVQMTFHWRDIEVPKYHTKLVETLSAEEIEIIRAALNIHVPADFRMRALIEVLLHTGMRISEALSINKEDIDLTNKEVTITNAKTKETQKVYLTGCITWINAYLESREDENPALFVVDATKSRYKQVRRLECITAKGHMIRFRKRLKKLGISKHVSFHIFRKTFCTHLIRSGVDIKTVQFLARHKSERTTLRHYISVDHERCKSEHNRVMASL